MNDESLPQDIWDGRRGWSILARAKRQYEEGGSIVAYASALYSVMNDYALWQFWYWPLRFTAFWNLYALLLGLPEHFDFNWTADQDETLAAILLRLSRSKLVPRGHREEFERYGEALVWKGINISLGTEVSFHTRVFLHLHAARLCFEEHSTGCYGARELFRKGRTHLAAAVENAEEVADANQRSRCFRGIAEVYGRSLGNHLIAKRYMDRAEGVPELGESVKRKNRKMRRRLGV